MTKWFDTNYHYLVPEIGPDTPLHFADDTVVRRFADAREWGYVTRPSWLAPSPTWRWPRPTRPPPTLTR